MKEIKINRPADPSNLTEMEKKHVPVIEAPDVVTADEPFEVTVKVGSIPHVVEDEHYIEWIELYLDKELVERKELSPSDEEAVVTFTVTASEDIIASREIMNCRIHGFGVCGECGTKSTITRLEAVESCNVHGLWDEAKGIEIVSKEVKPGKLCKW